MTARLDLENYITLREAEARGFGNYFTLYRLVKRGVLDAIQINNCYKVHLDNLEDLIKHDSAQDANAVVSSAKSQLKRAKKYLSEEDLSEMIEILKS